MLVRQRQPHCHSCAGSSLETAPYCYSLCTCFPVRCTWHGQPASNEPITGCVQRWSSELPFSLSPTPTPKPGSLGEKPPFFLPLGLPLVPLTTRWHHITAVCGCQVPWDGVLGAQWVHPAASIPIDVRFQFPELYWALWELFLIPFKHFSLQQGVHQAPQQLLPHEVSVGQK